MTKLDEWLKEAKKKECVCEDCFPGSLQVALKIIEHLMGALKYYADEGGGPYAPGDCHTADGGKRAFEAIAAAEKEILG